MIPTLRWKKVHMYISPPPAPPGHLSDLNFYAKNYYRVYDGWAKLTRHQQHRARQAEALELGYLDLGGEGG